MPDPAALPDESKKGGLASRAKQERSPNFDEIVTSVEDYAIFTLDNSGVIQNWNAGAERIKLYRANEIVGRHFSCFYSEEDRASGLPERELEIAVRERRFSDEGWRLRKDGTRFWASVAITSLGENESCREGFLKITRDLTERMLATEALRQSEERFRLLLESVVDHAIFMLDTEGHVVSWNEGARRLKGYEREEILGKHFSVFYPSETRSTHPHAAIRKALRDGRFECEGWRIRKDGSQFWGNVIITPLFDSAMVLRGFAKATRDMTHQLDIQRLQETDRRKNAFLATLAHELRNPLAPILVGMEVILNAKEFDSVAEVAPMIHRQIGQMAHLIDDLLDMSRVNTGKVVLKKSRVLLSEIFANAVEAVAPAVAAAGHELVIRTLEAPWHIEADPLRITQVVSNLLSNAAKFTPPAGRIVLEAAIEPDGKLHLSVSDNGPGIAPDLQSTVFELFEQGSSGLGGGLGIGLTLVKSLTEMHGGTVSVTSGGDGCGSEFHVFLPVLVPLENPLPAEFETHITLTRPSGPARILVVDDGKSAADIMGMFFQLEGMETAIAYDGVEAVEAAETFDPHLVCMDLGMPRMDGFEAARRIRMLNKNVVLVALSGWGSEDDRRRSAEAGFDFHLVKPVKPDDLRSMLAVYLSGQRD